MAADFRQSRRRILIFSLVVGIWALPAWAQGLDEADWPMWRGDERGSATVRLAARQGGKPRRWMYDLSGKVHAFEPGMTVWSSPALAAFDGRAWVAAGSYDHRVYLWDAASGELRFRYNTGAGVYATPAIRIRDGRPLLYAASSDRTVYALDAREGTRVFSVEVEPYRPTLGGARLSGPALGHAGGREALFVGHWVYDKSLGANHQQGGLSALDAASGERLWRTDFLDNRISHPVYLEIDGAGFLCVGSEDGNLRLLRADSGEIVWLHRESEIIQGSCAVWPDRDRPLVFAGSHFGKLRALDARSGEEVWSHKTGYWISATPVVIEGPGSAQVVVGSYDGKMYGLDARTGALRWSQDRGAPVYASAAVIDDGARPTVVAAALDHRLFGLWADQGTERFSVFTGAPLWDGISLGESTWSSPAAAEIDGRWMIFFGSYNGEFWGLPLSEAAIAGPGAPWSNVRFWVTMALVLLGVGGTAVFLSRRRVRGAWSRRKASRQCTPSSRCPLPRYRARRSP